MKANSVADIFLCVTTTANKKSADSEFEILMVAGTGFEPTTFWL